MLETRIDTRRFWLQFAGPGTEHEALVDSNSKLADFTSPTRAVLRASETPRAIHVQRFAQSGALSVLRLCEESITSLFSIRRTNPTPAASTISFIFNNLLRLARLDPFNLLARLDFRAWVPLHQRSESFSSRGQILVLECSDNALVMPIEMKATFRGSWSLPKILEGGHSSERLTPLERDYSFLVDPAGRFWALTSGLATNRDLANRADPSRSASDNYRSFASSDLAAMRIYWAHSDRVGGIRGIQ